MVGASMGILTFILLESCMPPPPPLLIQNKKNYMLRLRLELTDVYEFLLTCCSHMISVGLSHSPCYTRA